VTCAETVRAPVPGSLDRVLQEVHCLSGCAQPGVCSGSSPANGPMRSTWSTAAGTTPASRWCPNGSSGAATSTPVAAIPAPGAA